MHTCISEQKPMLFLDVHTSDAYGAAQPLDISSDVNTNGK